MTYKRNHSLKKAIPLLLLILCAAGALLTAYRLRGGTNIRPDREVSGSDPVYFRQRDPAWKDDPLGESRFTIGSSGCLISCIASAVRMEELDVENREALTPQTLAASLSRAGGFDSEGNLQWTALENTLGVRVKRESSASADEILTYLEQGIYPIVRVRVNLVGAVHYVLIVRAENGSFYCMDPLDPGDKPVPLSRFGNRIYAVRFVY